MRHPCTACCLLSDAMYSASGLSLQAANFSFQNNDKYWEDAKIFRPERFLANSSERASSLPAFCAFGDVSSAGHATWMSAPVQWLP